MGGEVGLWQALFALHARTHANIPYQRAGWGDCCGCGIVAGTLQAVESVADACRVAEVLTSEGAGGWNPDRYRDMDRLLVVGRALGGTHFVVLHGDEALSVGWLETGQWGVVLAMLRRGDSLSVAWAHFWKSLFYVRADWLLVGEVSIAQPGPASPLRPARLTSATAACPARLTSNSAARPARE